MHPLVASLGYVCVASVGGVIVDTAGYPMFTPASKSHAFIVPPGTAGGAVCGDYTGPRKRVRQRPPSSCLLQTQSRPSSTMSMMVGVIPPSPRDSSVPSRNRGGDGSGGAGVGVGVDGGVERQPRGRRGISTAVESGQTNSDNVYGARQRILAAGKRRRWTEVSRQLTSLL